MIKNIIKDYLINIIEGIDVTSPKEIINCTIKEDSGILNYKFYFKFFKPTNVSKEYDLKLNDLFFKKYNQILYNDVKNPYKIYPFTPTKKGKEIFYIQNQNFRFIIELDPALMIKRIREEKLNSIGL